MKYNDYVRTTDRAFKNGKEFVEGYIKNIEFGIATIFNTDTYLTFKMNVSDLQLDLENQP